MLLFQCRTRRLVLAWALFPGLLEAGSLSARNRTLAQTVECRRWWQMPATDVGADVCLIVKTAFGISKDEFFSLNPGLKRECSLEVGESYCVEAANSQPPTDIKDDSALEPAEQPTRTSITGPNAVETPLPTQGGLTKDCQLFHQVDSSESCQGILDEYGLFLEDFVSWNPGVEDDCTNMWADYYVCVGTQKKGSPSHPTPSRPVSSAAATPTPHQPGMIKGCKEFHYVEKDETCWVIGKMFGITPGQLFKWNPGVGRDCSAMWADSWLCVKV